MWAERPNMSIYVYAVYTYIHLWIFDIYLSAYIYSYSICICVDGRGVRRYMCVGLTRRHQTLVVLPTHLVVWAERPNVSIYVYAVKKKKKKKLDDRRGWRLL